MIFPFYFHFWTSYLNSILKREQFDIIHIHDLPLAKIGYNLSLKYNLRFVLDLHENYPYLLKEARHINTPLGRLFFSLPQWLNYEKQMLQKADVIISVIEEQKQRFTSIGGDEKRTFVVPNTPIVEEIKVNSIVKSEAKTTFIYAGNIDQSRGLELAMEAFKEVTKRHKGIKLQIIGDGKILPELKLYVEKERLDRFVEFLGWKPYSKMMEYISMADIALLPQLKSVNSDFGIPNKLFQYMLSGKPVIASNCSAVSRIVKETHSGLIFRNQDKTELIKAIEVAIQNRAMMMEMGASGRKWVLEKYNWDLAAQELLKAYNSL